jgi:hypothetical protein
MCMDICWAEEKIALFDIRNGSEFAQDFHSSVSALLALDDADIDPSDLV